MDSDLDHRVAKGSDGGAISPSQVSQVQLHHACTDAGSWGPSGKQRKFLCSLLPPYYHFHSHHRSHRLEARCEADQRQAASQPSGSVEAVTEVADAWQHEELLVDFRIDCRRDYLHFRESIGDRVYP